MSGLENKECSAAVATIQDGTIAISAGVSKAVASAFENQKALPKEGSLVVLKEVAGARYVPRYDHRRIREAQSLYAR